MSSSSVRFYVTIKSFVINTFAKASIVMTSVVFQIFEESSYFSQLSSTIQEREQNHDVDAVDPSHAGDHLSDCPTDTEVRISCVYSLPPEQLSNDFVRTSSYSRILSICILSSFYNYLRSSTMVSCCEILTLLLHLSSRTFTHTNTLDDEWVMVHSQMPCM